MAGRPQERSQLPGWGAANQGSITHSDPQDRLSAPQSLAQHRSLTRCTAQHPLAFRKEKRAQPALHDAPGKPGTARVRGDSETRRLQRDPGAVTPAGSEIRNSTRPGQVRPGSGTNSVTKTLIAEALGLPSCVRDGAPAVSSSLSVHGPEAQEGQVTRSSALELSRKRARGQHGRAHLSVQP